MEKNIRARDFSPPERNSSRTLMPKIVSKFASFRRRLSWYLNTCFCKSSSHSAGHERIPSCSHRHLFAPQRDLWTVCPWNRWNCNRCLFQKPLCRPKVCWDVLYDLLSRDLWTQCCHLLHLSNIGVVLWRRKRETKPYQTISSSWRFDRIRVNTILSQVHSGCVYA